MTTAADLFKAKAEGRQAFLRGEQPLRHPSQCGGELYEAWYDGWEAAFAESQDNLALSRGYDE